MPHSSIFIVSKYLQSIIQLDSKIVTVSDLKGVFSIGSMSSMEPVDFGSIKKPLLHTLLEPVN